MMEDFKEYHVKTSDENGVIYAGEGCPEWGDKWHWTNSTDVTQEALTAVIDYLIYKANALNQNQLEYVMYTIKGERVRLMVDISNVKTAWESMAEAPKEGTE